MSSAHLHPKRDIEEISFFESLLDYKFAVMHAIATQDQRALEDLYKHFAVSDYGALRVGRFQHATMNITKEKTT